MVAGVQRQPTRNLELITNKPDTRELALKGDKSNNKYHQGNNEYHQGNNNYHQGLFKNVSDRLVLLPGSSG